MLANTMVIGAMVVDRRRDDVELEARARPRWCVG